MDERILSGVLGADESGPEVTLRPRALAIAPFRFKTIRRGIGLMHGSETT